MKEFLFLFRSKENAVKNLSPEEMQLYMQKWGKWTKKLNEENRLKHGDRLSRNDAKVIRNTGENITDGPFIESKEVIGGYMVILANDINEAVEISKECPVYNINGSLEIRTSAY